MFLLIADRLGRGAILLSCAILVAMVALILCEILLRAVFSTSTFIMSEVVGYGVAAMTFLSFAATLREGVFIRVSLLLGSMRPPLRRAVEVGSCIVGTLLFGFLTAFVVRSAIRNFERNTVSNSVLEAPKWIPEAIAALGLAIFVIQFLALSLAYARGEPIRDRPTEV